MHYAYYHCWFPWPVVNSRNGTKYRHHCKSSYLRHYQDVSWYCCKLHTNSSPHPLHLLSNSLQTSNVDSPEFLYSCLHKIVAIFLFMLCYDPQSKLRGWQHTVYMLVPAACKITMSYLRAWLLRGCDDWPVSSYICCFARNQETYVLISHVWIYSETIDYLTITTFWLFCQMAADMPAMLNSRNRCTFTRSIEE